MRIFDSLGLGSCRWGREMDGQKCDIGSCRTWSRRVKVEEWTAGKSFKLLSATRKSGLLISRGAHHVECPHMDLIKFVLPASLEDRRFRFRSCRTSSSIITGHLPEEADEKGTALRS